VLDRRDPEHWRTLEFRKSQRDSEFRLRQIGEAAYLRSIMFLGYNEREARTELSLLKMEQATMNKSTPSTRTIERSHGRTGRRCLD
jgi:hypothetical protein